MRDVTLPVGVLHCRYLRAYLVDIKALDNFHCEARSSLRWLAAHRANWRPNQRGGCAGGIRLYRDRIAVGGAGCVQPQSPLPKLAPQHPSLTSSRISLSAGRWRMSQPVAPACAWWIFPHPADPVEVGAWDSPGYAEGVAVAGNVVYLADGPYGLRVVDVSDSANPTPLGSAYEMNYAFEVTVSGTHAYMAGAGAGLLVADITDPTNPLEVGRLDTPGYAYSVAVSGTMAYVADAWEGPAGGGCIEPGPTG